MIKFGEPLAATSPPTAPAPAPAPADVDVDAVDADDDDDDDNSPVFLDIFHTTKGNDTTRLSWHFFSSLLLLVVGRFF